MTSFFKDKISKIQIHGRSAAIDIYYSIDAENSRSVPLRVLIYTDETAKTPQFLFEFFNFRLETPDPEVFKYNELTVCQTTHDPKIPQLTSSFHSKMEVKDYVRGNGADEGTNFLL